jgi:prepilin-type N-terminal cleavage/methylation domain-containing protein
MKRGFTLIELLVVVVVLVTLMSIMFRIGSVGGSADNRNRTIVHMQRLENCLSGYYAAFGSYPPVKLHGTRDFYMKVGSHGIQTDVRNESIWGWDPKLFLDGKYQPAEVSAWQQVKAACLAQPIACQFPFPEGYGDMVRSVSDEIAERANSGDDDYRSYWEDPTLKSKLSAGFDDGGASSGSTGRFASNKDEVDWRYIQLFKFGLMSYLLPRYLVMMNGHDDFFTGGFAQWDVNNELPCDPFTGNRFSNWQQVKNRAESNRQSDQAYVANIPSQALCARWMPNLEGICKCNHDFSLFGIDIRETYENRSLISSNIEIFSPEDESGGSNKDQYILDEVTVKDGWHHELFYYSPEPHQTYILWSAGPNGRTFPAWISRKGLTSKANECVAAWTSDDIIHLSN